MLNIRKAVDGTALMLSLDGRLDTTTSPALEAELKKSLPCVSVLCFDCAQLAYISSAGLRVLLSAQKIMNRQGEMKLIHVSDAILEIFEVTGFSDILTIV